VTELVRQRILDAGMAEPVVESEQRMIDPATQTFMAERMGAHLRTHPVDHAPLISHPELVADIVTAAFCG
jgi:hypothetical protein